MNIKSINLRRCSIKELDSELRHFVTEDLLDKSRKVVYLSGKQRLYYKEYSIGDYIYTAKTIGNI